MFNPQELTVDTSRVLASGSDNGGEQTAMEPLVKSRIL